MKKIKKVSLSHSITEALMIVFLVLLFAVPFMIAVVLTPGYKSPSKVTDINRPEPANVASAENIESGKVLGFESEKSLKMLVPTTMKNVSLESYTVSEKEGVFRYRVIVPQKETVLTVKNESSSRISAKAWLSDLLGGEAYIGTRKYEENLVVTLDSGEDLSISVKPAKIGHFDIQITAL